MRLFNHTLLLLSSLLFSSSVFAKHVMFDQAHGQRFLINENRPLDLTLFAELFQSAEVTVGVNQAPLTNESLANTNVLIISGAFARYSDKELAAIQQFITRGGALCVMLHVGPINGALLSSLNVAVTNGVIKERLNQIEGQTGDFSVNKLKSHAIVTNIARINYYGSWAVKGLSPNINEFAFTSEQAWIDLNRNKQHDAQEPTGEWAVALTGTIGAGKFAVFGDDAVFQNQFLTDDNHKMAENLVKWLLN